MFAGQHVVAMYCPAIVPCKGHPILFGFGFDPQRGRNPSNPRKAEFLVLLCLDGKNNPGHLMIYSVYSLKPYLTVIIYDDLFPS